MVGSTEVVIIVGAVLILFGGAAIPKFARSIGKARKEFEAGLKESKEETEKKDDSKSEE